MSRYIKITMFTLACFCLNINNKSYACDQLPKPLIVADPNVFIYYVTLGNTLNFNSNSYDPDNGEPFGDNNGIADCNWSVWDYTTTGTAYLYYEHHVPPYTLYTFDPNALGPEELVLKPGLYGIDLNVTDDENAVTYGNAYKTQYGSWCGTRDIYVVDAKFTSDTNDIPCGAGNTFHYTLLPDLEWNPTIVFFRIYDEEENWAFFGYSTYPPTGVNIDIPWDGMGNMGSYDESYLPPGNYTAMIYLNKGSAHIEKQIPIKIYKVTNVQWKKFGSNWDLGNDSEGKTIFPDKKDYNDNDPNRNKIYVEATITPPLSNELVYFMWMDVDDPCGSPIDTKPDGHPNTGPDNFGGTGAFLSPEQAYTDVNGIARAVFTVTNQPGDNFRIVAAGDQDQLSLVNYNNIEGNEPIYWPTGVYFSPTLTVWRHLWIERDSMKSVTSAGYVISEDFSSGLPGSPTWTYYSNSQGQINVTSGRLRLDDSIADDTYSLNEAILHFNYTGMTNARLILDHNNLLDESHSMPASFTGHNNCDGIALSVDGQHWRRIANLTSNFTNLYFYLNNVISQAIDDAGSSDVNDVQIKFQQYDNTYAPNDGREFDNILLIVYNSEKNFVYNINATYSYNAGTNQTTVDLGGTILSDFRDDDHFSFFQPLGSGFITVLSTDLHFFGNDEIKVPGNLTGYSPVYLLYDDDYQFFPSHGIKVTLPSTTTLQKLK